MGKWNLSVLLCCSSTWGIGFLKTRTAKMASPLLWVRDTECALDELPVSVCHRYRVSPAQPHTGSESHLFTSRLQTADSSSPRVTGRGGGQISFWNFNLLQLNYLISEPPTSKEYLSSPPPWLPWWRLSFPSPKGLTHFISLPCGLNDAPLKSYSAPWNQRYTALINRSVLRAVLAGGEIIVWNFSFVTMHSHFLSNCKTIICSCRA